MPTAAAGIPVIGATSVGMLDVCRRHAAKAGVLELLDLRLGDIADPRSASMPCSSRALPVLPAPDGPAGPAVRAQGRPRPAPSRWSVHLRRLRPVPRRHRGDARAPDRARAGHLRAGGLIRRSAHCSSVCRGWRVDDAARLISADEWRQALEEVGFEVELAHGWFDYRPTRCRAMTWSRAERFVESLTTFNDCMKLAALRAARPSGVARFFDQFAGRNGQSPFLGDARAAPPRRRRRLRRSGRPGLACCACRPARFELRADFVHPRAWVADHRDLELGAADAQSLADRPRGRHRHRS